METQRPQYRSKRKIFRHVFYPAKNFRSTFLIFHHQFENCRQCSNSLWQRPNFSNPRLTFNLSLESIDEVIGHTLLPNHHLLRSTNNKISALIVRALPQTNPLLFRTFSQSAPQRSHHNRGFRHLNLVNIFCPNVVILIGLRVSFALTINQINPNFTLIIEISKSAHHGVNLDRGPIRIFVVGCSLVDLISKLELPLFLLIKILSCTELRSQWYDEIPIFGDHLFHVEGKAIV